MKIIDNILVEVDEFDYEDGILEIPEGVEKIAPNACRNLYDLEQVYLPNSLKQIGKGAFSNCEDLTAIKGNVTLDRIEDLAFSGCVELQSVNLNKVNFIGNEAFSDCKSLRSITLDCQEFGYGVFKDCDNLIEVDLLSRTNIGEDMFNGCRALSYIDDKYGVASIGANAFKNCKSLLQISIDSKSNIDENAFNDSSITNIKILDKDTEIYDDFPLKNLNIDNEGIEAIFGDEKARSIQYLNYEKGLYQFDLIDLENKIKDIDYVFENKSIKQIVEWIDIIQQVQKIPREKVRLPQAEAIMLLDNSKDKIEFIKNLGKYNKVSGKYRELNLNDRIQILKLCKLLGIFEDDDKQFVFGANILSKDLPNFIEKMDGVKLNEFKGTRFLITDWFKFINYPNDFSKKRAKFFVDNYKKLLEDNKINLLAISLNDFDNLSKSSNNLNIDKIEEIYMRDLPPGLSENQKELAKLMIMQGAYSSEAFSQLNNILEKAEQGYPNIFDKISAVNEEIDQTMRQKATHLVDELDANIQYEWLDKDSPYNLLIGNICGCCARLGREGEDIMVKSALHSSVQTMALKKKDGEYMGKATVYINRDKGYAVFNNLELNRNYSTRAKKEDFDEVMSAFMRGAEAFVKTYNDNNKDNPLQVVTIGADKNKIIERIRERLPKSAKIYPSIEFEGYKKGGDSGKEQFVVYKN